MLVGGCDLETLEREGKKVSTRSYTSLAGRIFGGESAMSPSPVDVRTAGLVAVWREQQLEFGPQLQQSRRGGRSTVRAGRLSAVLYHDGRKVKMAMYYVATEASWSRTKTLKSNS